MFDFVVAIPSFRRPQGLERLLRALAALDTEARMRVLVADNDAELRQAEALCRRIASEPYRWPLDAIVVSERGIAQARNALVERVLADPAIRFVAMLDDDEWPRPDWLDALLRAQTASGADVVHGSVLREFETVPPRWARGWEGIAEIRCASGQQEMLDGIGNVLIRRAVLEALEKPCFDDSFGMTGGEDKDFFVRLRSAGARFVHADEAVVYEHVPATRTRLRWLLMRSFRTGNTDMRIALKYRATFGARSLEFAKIAAAFAAVPILSVAGSFTPERRLDGVYKLFRAAGKVAALLGHRYDEYATIHGK